MDPNHRGQKEAQAKGLSAQTCSLCRQELAIERFFAASPKVALCKRCDVCRKKHAEEDRAAKVLRRKRQRELENQDVSFDRDPSVDSTVPAALPSAATTPTIQETPARQTTGGKSVKRLSDVFRDRFSDDDIESEEDNLLSQLPLPPSQEISTQESVQTGPEAVELPPPSSTPAKDDAELRYRHCGLCGLARALNRVETLSHGMHLCEYCKASNSAMQWCVQCSQEKPKIQFMDRKAEFHGTCNQCRATEEDKPALTTSPQETTGSKVTLARGIKRPRLTLRVTHGDK